MRRLVTGQRKKERQEGWAQCQRIIIKVAKCGPKQQNNQKTPTTPHQRDSAKLENLGLASFSARKMRKDEKISPRNPMYSVVKSSCAEYQTKKYKVWS
jgi:hypothetical protein